MDKELKGLTKNQRKEYLKNLREKQDSSSKLAKQLPRMVLLLAIFLVLGFGLYLYLKPAAPKPKLGQTYAIASRTHIPEGSNTHPPYNSNPPSSGDHWPTPATCKVYTEEIPDEAALHSLEHGAVWISYKDKNDKDTIKRLTGLAAGGGGKILLIPRSKDDSKIAVGSWGRVMKLEKYDEQKIKDYIRYYRNASPEPTAGC